MTIRDRGGFIALEAEAPFGTESLMVLVRGFSLPKLEARLEGTEMGRKSQMHGNGSIRNRFIGHYISDMDCVLCTNCRGEKRGCRLPRCGFEDEKRDAARNGRITRHEPKNRVPLKTENMPLTINEFIKSGANNQESSSGNPIQNPPVPVPAPSAGTPHGNTKLPQDLYGEAV